MCELKGIGAVLIFMLAFEVILSPLYALWRAVVWFVQHWWWLLAFAGGSFVLLFVWAIVMTYIEDWKAGKL